MFTLIKREISDNLVYFIGAAALSALIVFVFSVTAYHQDAELSGTRFFSSAAMGLSVPAMVVSAILLCGMGSSQMHIDKNRHISSFLATLPITRQRILVARLIAGLLVVLTLTVPILIAATFIASMLVSPFILPVVNNTILTGFLCVSLLAYACYCIGLQTGWTSNRITPTLGALVLTLVLLPIIAIKGIGAQAIIILILFITASIVRTWVKFTSTSL
jgi:hypothetical protein